MNSLQFVQPEIIMYDDFGDVIARKAILGECMSVCMRTETNNCERSWRAGKPLLESTQDGPWVIRYDSAAAALLNGKCMQSRRKVTHPQ